MALNQAVLLYEPTSQRFPLAQYDSMCRAIEAAHAIDEVKNIRDAALRFEAYCRQAQNVEAERRACQIRLRAEKKAGALDKQREKAKGGRPPKTGRGVQPVSPTLAELGVSKHQMRNWRKLDDVPAEIFETALADPEKKPSTTSVIAAGTPPKPETIPVSDEALWLWGRLRDFERNGMLARAAADVLLTMTPEMADDVHRLAPRVAAWLGAIGRINHD